MGSRGSIVIAAIVAVILGGGAGAFVLWRVHRSSAADQVSLRDGELTFRAPTGWQRESCPDEPGCVDLIPPGVSPGPAGSTQADILVIIAPADRNALEGDISFGLLDPASGLSSDHYFTVDGVRFVRARADDDTHLFEIPGGTLVVAILANGDTVRMVCTENTMAEVIKAGCDEVIGSLHVHT
jgi:hypothetical protein